MDAHPIASTFPEMSPAEYRGLKDFMNIYDIEIDGRTRNDMGDIDALAASIQEIGLLHPIVITPDRKLIAGERRLLAYRLLAEKYSRNGWHEIRAADQS